MTTTILETKVQVPMRRAGLVRRPRLAERLDASTSHRVTLVTGPAGYGKTTSVVEWATDPAAPRPVAWLSLDPSDDDPATFWAYAIAALRQVLPHVGEGARLLLDAPRVRIEQVLAALLNELGRITADLVLVLDDLHVIESPEIHEALAFLIDRLPPRVHLVVVTRADPPLPLARLRARGELLEVRAGDLRFTLDEASTYLSETMRLPVTGQDVVALERRTEGWIAALQLAGLSMQGREDLSGFIAGFAGDDRYIVDYLVEEVLRRQPPDRRGFLLRTSILERLSGPLCDAVTLGSGSRAMLETLDRANLLLVPLDDQRRWYRYHHLFGDLLRTRLADEAATEIPELHRRASAWLAAEGDRPAAIRHAMAGGDLARAADLIAEAIPDMRRTRQEVTLRGWLGSMPRDVLRERPQLGLAYAGTLLQTGSLAGVDELLGDVERWQATQPSPASGTHGPASMPVEVAMYRAAHALMTGDLATTKVQAQRALDLADPTDQLGQGAGGALLGLAYWTEGDLAEAERRYADAMASLERAGFVSDVLGASIALADLQLGLGRPDDARRTYERGLALATGPDGVPLRGAADMHVGLGSLARERDDVADAKRHLGRCLELGEANGLPQAAYRWRLLSARIHLTEGDVERASDLMTEAERWHTTDMSPDVQPLAAVRARLAVTQGTLDEAWRWARLRDLAADEAPTYLREYELATFARLVVATAGRDRDHTSLGQAVALLDRLHDAAEAGGRAGSVLDIRIAEALARHAQRDAPGARAALDAAVAIAEPHGYVRAFLDEGPPMDVGRMSSGSSRSRCAPKPRPGTPPRSRLASRSSSR